MALVWVDILKGIGILLVVLGHMTTKETFLTNFIYLFHMPLFFFVSGYLFKPNENLMRYAKKKAIHLLIPYISFFLILFFIPQLIITVVHKAYDFGTFKWLVETVVLGGRLLKGVESVFWFVTCLFLTQQLVNWLVVSYQKNTVLLAMAVLFGLSFINQYFNQFWLPFNANVVLAAAPIMYAGYLFKLSPENGNYYLAAGFITGVSIISLLLGFNNTYDMKVALYGIPIVTYICAIAVIVSLIKLAKLLEQSTWAAAGLSKLGQASLVIMFLHQLILIRSKPYLGDNNEVIRFLLALVFTYCAYLLIKKFTLTRALLLGSEKDFKLIFKHQNPTH